MASITIRNLDDDVKTRLRVRAAEHHRSMEEEVCVILRDAVGRKPSSRDLATIIHSHFGPANGVDLELPPREPLSFATLCRYVEATGTASELRDKCCR